MKNRTKLLALILALLFIVGTLSACGARAPEAEAPMADAPAAAPEEAPMEYERIESDMLTDSSQNAQVELPTDRKLITTVHMEAETEDLDAMLVHINSKITARKLFSQRLQRIDCYVYGIIVATIVCSTATSRK